MSEERRPGHSKLVAHPGHILCGIRGPHEAKWCLLDPQGEQYAIPTPPEPVGDRFEPLRVRLAARRRLRYLTREIEPSTLAVDIQELAALLDERDALKHGRT